MLTASWGTGLLPGTGDVEDSDGVGLLEYAAEAAPGRAKPVDTIAPADGVITIQKEAK